MGGRAHSIAVHSIVIAVSLGLAGARAAEEGVQPKTSCLAAAKMRAEKGDGQAAKALAVHYGDSSNSDASPSLAWRYLRRAIEKGVDVSDVPTAKGNIKAYCSRDAVLVRLLADQPPASGGKRTMSAAAAKPARQGPAEPQGQRTKPASSSAVEAPAPVRPRTVAVVAPDVPQASTAVHHEATAPREAASSKDAVVADTSPKTIVAATHLSGNAIELERQAADSEWNGNVRAAITYWEKARRLGSKAAARRLYQIFSFGAGDVEADYVKAIEAHQYALQMGLDVPPLPRK